jgi:hypothetical protein
MRSQIMRAAAASAAAAFFASALSFAQPLPLEPPKEAGQSVTPAFEGWYQNEDGSYSLLIGYFNRNTKQVLDIPVGPNNRIEPGGPDYGQPTHFLPRRQWGVVAIKVPKDFGTKKLTWTIVANGKSQSIPVGLIKDYQVEPFKEVAQGNTPPVLRFERGGPAHAGPPKGIAASLSATVGQPLTLDVWASDQGPKPEGGGGAAAARFANIPPVSVTWTKYRGPGEVTFGETRPKIDDKQDGKATTTATFSEPGEYWLRVQGNDRSGDGGGGFQCCWTNTYVKVTVKGGPTSSTK